MATQEVAQSVPRLTCPPKPPGVLAWGEPDGDLMNMWTDEGLWFTFDMRSGKTIRHPALPSPEPIDVVASFHAHADQSDTFSKCYFIGGESGPVKIGHSVDVKKRLRDLQMCSPIALSILALHQGGEERETAYHLQFADHRLHGEWFERCPEIENEIARLNAP